MNYKFTNAIAFAVGAAIGSAVTWKVLKNKYERIVQEEIESIRESLTSIPNDTQEQEDCEMDEEEDEERPRESGRVHQINWDELEDLDEGECEYDPDDEDLVEYERLTSKYTNEKGGAENVAKQPYVISPYDYGEIDGYRLFSLTYYTDGVLEDEDDEIVTDVDELIGAGSLNTFGEYEDDSVYVRNEQLRSDFEILKDPRTYKNAHDTSPDKVRGE